MSDNQQEKLATQLSKTLQLNTPVSWSIQGIKMRLGEISTSATIAKQCGSIFSRPENSKILDAFEVGLGIRVRALPTWLYKIQLIRSITIRGAHMRRIEVPKTMEDLDMFKLSGLATFVILCCRYTEDEETMITMLELLMAGELGTALGNGQNEEEKVDKNEDPMPYTFKAHLGAFVKSCLDADRDSDVSKRASRWMAELHCSADLNIKSKETFLRRQQASFDLVGELLGTAGIEEQAHMASRGGELFHFQMPTGQECPAAAHGASVIVEIATENGFTIYPKEKEKGLCRSSSFLVRLWLTQPPEHIRGILRYSKHPDASESSKDIACEDVTVIGGAYELSTWIARKIGFQCRLLDNTTSVTEALLDLWKRGVNHSKTLRLVVRKHSSGPNLPSTCENLVLVSKNQDDSPKTIPSEALPLARDLLSRDRRLGELAKSVANIIHDLYGLDDYFHLLQNDSNKGDSEIVKAMQFLLISISVGILQNTIHPASDTPDMYALNLATLNPQTQAIGSLYDFIRCAVDLREGVAPYKLVATAATVWGGAPLSSIGRPGYEKPVEHLLGVIAPQCTILLDIIRDPLPFVRDGRTDQLLSIWRGAVPMLPRDPATNCIYSGYNERSTTTDISPKYKPRIDLPIDQSLKKPMLWTFEPFDHEATRGIFCFWYNGHLVAEFAPHSIFTTILSGSKEAQEHDPNHQKSAGKGQRAALVELTKSDLLDIRRFAIQGNVTVTINGLDDLGWAMFAFGCAADASSISSERCSPVFAHRGHANDFNIDENQRGMSENAIILLIPLS